MISPAHHQLPGTQSEETYSRIEQASFGLSQSARLSRLSIEEGKGVYLRDVDGNWYLDLHSGPGVMSTGHGHPVVISAMKEQLGKLTNCHDLGSLVRLELHERLERAMPGPARRMAFLSGGAEAVELALRVSRQITGRDTVVSFSGAFHGKTLGALACTDPQFRNGWWCDSGRVVRLRFGECARCSYDDSHPCDGDVVVADCIAELEKCSTLPAALLIEPVQGTAGNLFPAKNFIEQLFTYCRNRGIVTIADEILTGCGRTGSFLATESLKVPPDIILLGKGIGSGFPISAVLIKEDIVEPMIDLVGAASTSFGGNPMSACAAVATLRTIEDEGLVENSRLTGRIFLQHLLNLESRHEVIRNVRGRGLMLAFDLDSKFGEDIGVRFFRQCLKNGLMIVGSGNRIRINPPLVFTSDHVEEAITKFDHIARSLT